MPIRTMASMEGERVRLQVPILGINPYLFVGSTPLDMRWVGSVSSQAPAVATVGTNNLRAYPAFLPRTVSFDRIGFELCTAVGGGVARVGIYDTLSETTPRPNNLIFDAGEQDCSTGVGMKETTPTRLISLKGPALYWLANLIGNTAPGLRCVPAAGVLPILGWPATGGANFQTLVIKSMSYAALPTTFGVPSSVGTGTPAAVGLRITA